jgi:hypothetical protein
MTVMMTAEVRIYSEDASKRSGKVDERISLLTNYQSAVLATSSLVPGAKALRLLLLNE